MKTPRPRPSAPPRITPRRRPRLRLVSHTHGGAPRHAAAPTILGLVHIVEVITFAEMDAMTRAERPERAFVLPGLGFLVVRAPLYDHEAEDVESMAKQVYEAWEGYED
jgi:hypothetical protein